MASRGRAFVVEWQAGDDAGALQAAYRKEKVAAVKPRLQALWLLRDGRRLAAVAAVVGVEYRTAQRWVSWYRAGGLEAVRAHRQGGQGQRPRLTPEQQATVAQEIATGRFPSVRAIHRWIVETFGVRYTEDGVESLVERLRAKPKVPRPLHPKADLVARERWKKGGSKAS
jgi:transposase